VKKTRQERVSPLLVASICEADLTRGVVSPLSSRPFVPLIEREVATWDPSVSRFEQGREVVMWRTTREGGDDVADREGGR